MRTGGVLWPCAAAAGADPGAVGCLPPSLQTERLSGAREGLQTCVAASISARDWRDAHRCGTLQCAAESSASSHAHAGTAEDAQLFNTDYISRGSHGNLRAEADDVLFRLLTGYLKDQLGHESRLRTLPQKAALLSALQPRDRLRTLGLVRPAAPVR